MTKWEEILFAKIKCPFCKELIDVSTLYQHLGAKNKGFYIQQKCLNCRNFFRIKVGSIGLEFKEKFNKIAKFIEKLSKFPGENIEFRVECLFCPKKAKVLVTNEDDVVIEFIKTGDCCDWEFHLSMCSKPENVAKGKFRKFTTKEWQSFLLNLADSIRDIKKIL